MVRQTESHHAVAPSDVHVWRCGPVRRSHTTRWLRQTSTSDGVVRQTEPHHAGRLVAGPSDVDRCVPVCRCTSAFLSDRKWPICRRRRTHHPYPLRPHHLGGGGGNRLASPSVASARHTIVSAADSARLPLSYRCVHAVRCPSPTPPSVTRHGDGAGGAARRRHCREAGLNEGHMAVKAHRWACWEQSLKLNIWGDMRDKWILVRRPDHGYPWGRGRLCGSVHVTCHGHLRFRLDILLSVRRQGSSYPQVINTI